ncbi:MAG: 16S rRNA (guanine(527)-N(7))-methyltransferase RsmG [Peptococcaceae bacterium]|nr:16S rRNA (guanine(527)-N(7))-methyltransferase RsmG [Peptococcaceae bacterium]
MPDQDQQISRHIDVLKNMAMANWDLHLNEIQLSQLTAYTVMLLDWNKKINLTAITDPAQIMIKHFLDSMVFVKKLDYFYPQKKLLLADIGTGAGFPGIPIKILRPQINITLIDSLAKRISYLDHVIEALNLKGIKAIHARAEDIGRDQEHRECYDVVVARAVAEFPVLLEYCTPLLKIGGRFIAAKGLDPEKEILLAKNALNVLNCQIELYENYKLAEGADHRSLIIVRKTGQTLAQYPRKPGKPKKDPL